MREEKRGSLIRARVLNWTGDQDGPPLLLDGEDGERLLGLARLAGRESGCKVLDLLHLPLSMEEKEGSTGWRELRRQLSLRAVEPQIYLLNTGERMEVQHAMLKLLEEPPAQTRLLLVRQASRPLLPTVSSRCLHLRVPPSTHAELEESAEEAGFPSPSPALLRSAAGSRERLLWLLREPELSEALQSREAGPLARALRACPDEPSKRALLRLIAPAWAALWPRHASQAGEALQLLNGGVRAELCLLLLLTPP